MFHQAKGGSASTEALPAAGLSAMWRTLSKCGDIVLLSVTVVPGSSCLILWLPRSLVTMLSYGILQCFAIVLPGPLWRAQTLSHRMSSDDLHRVQSVLMRQLGGRLCRSTSRQVMLQSLGVGFWF